MPASIVAYVSALLSHDNSERAEMSCFMRRVTLLSINNSMTKRMMKTTSSSGTLNIVVLEGASIVEETEARSWK